MGIWLFLASEVMLFGGLFSAYVLLRSGSLEWPLGSKILNVPIGTFNTLVLISSSVTMVLAWAALKTNNFKKFKIFSGSTVLLALTFLLVKAYEYGSKFAAHEAHLEFDTPLAMQVAGMIIGGIVGFFKAHLLLKIFAGLILFFCAFLCVNSARKNFKNFLTKVAWTAGILAFIGVLITIFQIGSATSHHYHPPGENTFMAVYFTLTGLHGLHVVGGIIVIGYFWGAGSKMWNTEPERFTNRLEVAGLYWHFVDLVWIFLFPVLYLL